MRDLVLPAVCSASLAVSSWAYAGETETGIVAAIDVKAGTLTLDTGVIYHLARDLDVPLVQPGQSVGLTWAMDNGRLVVNDLTILS